MQGKQSKLSTGQQFEGESFMTSEHVKETAETINLATVRER